MHAHRGRALSPDRPFIRGTAQNPDTYFQSRETVNPYYARTAEIVQGRWTSWPSGSAAATGSSPTTGIPRRSACSSWSDRAPSRLDAPSSALASEGERVGAVQIRSDRPFPARQMLAALPPTVRRVAVLDRTKEPGSEGEPLFLDVVAALGEAHTSGERDLPLVVGGRYGLSSKEFTPGDGRGRAPGARRRPPATPVHGRHHGRRRRHSISIGAPLDIEPPGRCARSSSASAPTAPSARTRTRSRSSATPASAPRATSSTTRRSRARRRSRICASATSRSRRRTS